MPILHFTIFSNYLKFQTMKIKLDKTKIAGNLTIKDWHTLMEELDPRNDEAWGKAYNFFEQRITNRHLNPINKILNMRLNSGEGFAVVSLQCSLIETVESFYNGWIYEFPTYKKEGKIVKNKKGHNLNNCNIFESFFQNRIPFTKIDGKDFFFNVRCALLHESQTKNGWRILGRNSSNNFFRNIGRESIIYRSNFQNVINEVILNYKMAIVFGSSYGELSVPELRTNFTNKFNHICQISLG